MSVHVLLYLFNELRKRDTVRGLPSILSLFRNEFKITLKSQFCCKIILSGCTIRNVVMGVTTYIENL